VDPIETTVKQYILDEFLPGEDPANLEGDTPLMTGGILDSLATLKLVAFLEERYRVTIGPHEASVDHANTIRQIAALVRGKLGPTG
jgi:acyl carrier protein